MAPLNPVIGALVARGIELPRVPIDLSEALRAADIQRAYVITITGRCGSTWLAKALSQLDSCGNPLEYFSEEAIPHYGNPDGSGSFLQYATSLIQQKRTGKCFGLKIDGVRLGWISEVCELRKSFPGSLAAWVDLRRMNIVRQAFSFARAKHTGIWHVDTAEKDLDALVERATREIEIPDQLIWTEIISIVRSEKLLDEFYRESELAPMRIVYEELVDAKPALLLRVLAHLFPKRSFTCEQVAIVDRTMKIAGDSVSHAELRFVERHVRTINQFYEFRMDADVGSSVIDLALVKSLRYS